MAIDENGKDATLLDYALVVRRKKWLVLGVAVALMALALAYSFLKTPMYRASAQLIYEKELDVADPLSARRYVDPAEIQRELNGVAVAIASPEIIESAGETLSSSAPASSYSVSAGLDVPLSGTDTSTVSVTAESVDPVVAARVANAYAEAFTAARKSREQARVVQAQTVIQGELRSLNSAAERQSAEYLTLQQRLQDLKILEATVTGNFRVIIPATPPMEPFSPRSLRNGLLGLLGGLIAGIALALMLEQFDTRVRTIDEAVAIVGMPLLSHIGAVSSTELDQQPLYVLGNKHSQPAEAVRRLRGNLEFADIDGDLRSLLITSCLQHEGKSLTVCNMAVALAAAGKRVVLVDGDLRSPRVHRYLHMPNAIGLSSVLAGKSDLERALRSRAIGSSLTTLSTVSDSDSAADTEPRLHVLTSGPVPPNPAELIASSGFVGVIDQLRGEFDLVVVDTPALLAVGDAAAIARCVDGLILLLDLSQARRPLLREAVAQISQMPCHKLGLVAISPKASRHPQYERYAHDSLGDATAVGEADSRTTGGIPTLRA